MKVARPAIPLSMVESRSKKVAFLREVIRATELQAVEVVNSRIEELPGSVPTGSVGLVTMRAVRLTPRIVSSMCELVGQHGKVILFGCPDRAPLWESFSEETFDSEISLLTLRRQSEA
jgi:16S rRNA G527 N7-methylase RsmG